MAVHLLQMGAEKSHRSIEQRRSVNIVGILASLFVPWLIFCGLSTLMTFELRYRYQLLVYIGAAAALALVLLFGLMAWAAWKAKSCGEPSWEPSWCFFVFATGGLAWLLGINWANQNFFENLMPYYDVQNLGTYVSVDPSRIRGQQLMDAGRVSFVPGARLDLSKAESFRNLDNYCVVPIVVGDAPLDVYDFWAVGMNCCNSETGDFRCGDAENPNAAAGLRLMQDSQRPFFRLAVEQAESTYNIRANHPLFFHWMSDTAEHADIYRRAGYQHFLLGIYGHFVFQGALVLLAAWCNKACVL
jgi:hypothetical protein